MPAVGTATLTPNNQAGVRKFSIAWTCTAGGAVSGNPFTVPAGFFLGAKFVPASGGTQPTDLYDVTLKDEDGADALRGSGVDLSNATPKYAPADPPLWLDGVQQLDLVVANAGASKAGTVILYLK